MMNRREFFGYLTGSAVAARLALATGTGLAVFEEGCTPATVFAAIKAWEQTGEDTINSIVSILTANNIIISTGAQTIIGIIETAFNDLINAVNDYYSATPPSGIVARITAILQDIATEFANFASQLPAPANGIVATVLSLVGLVVSAVEGFISQLPTTAAVQAREIRVNGAVVTAKVMTKNQFRNSWNGTLKAAAASGLKCPKNAYL